MIPTFENFNPKSLDEISTLIEESLPNLLWNVSDLITECNDEFNLDLFIVSNYGAVKIPIRIEDNKFFPDVESFQIYSGESLEYIYMAVDHIISNNDTIWITIGSRKYYDEWEEVSRWPIENSRILSIQLEKISTRIKKLYPYIQPKVTYYRDHEFPFISEWVLELIFNKNDHM